MQSSAHRKLELSFTRALFSLWTIQGFISFGILISLQFGSEKTFFSLTPRLFESLLVGLVTFLFLLCTNFSFKKSECTQKVITFLSKKKRKGIFFFLGIFLPLGNKALLLILKALSKNEGSYYYAGYANHLKPVLTFFSLIGFELALWILFLNRYHVKKAWSEKKENLPSLFITWGILGILASLFLLFRIQFKEKTLSYLAGPAVPVLEWQIFLAWILAIITILFSARHKKSSPRHLDLWLVGIIWAIASLLWLSQPLQPGYGAQFSSAPNYEIYPFSDAQLYAKNAQALLIGKGMIGGGEEFPARPLYVLFLAISHAIAQQNYLGVIVIQSMLLAFFPATLYLLGKEIYSRPLGIAVATLAILRDITSNQVAPFMVSITYSKLFLSELPVALLLSLVTLLSIKWIKNNSVSKLLPFISGGLLGLSTLIRTQSIVAILPIFIVLLLSSKKVFWKKSLFHFLLFLLGITMSLSPWLWRNWKHTGGLVIDNPLSQMNVFAARYSDLPEGSVIPHLPTENDSEYSARMLNLAIESVISNPQKIIGSITNHFIQNEIGSLLVFPLRGHLSRPGDLLVPTDNFWENWNTPTALAKNTLLIFYIMLLGIGLATAWKNLRWLGLLPLVINLGYNAWTALFLASGIRFIVPVDWVFYLYEMLGLVVLTNFTFSALGTFTKKRGKEVSSSAPKYLYILITLLIFLSAIGLPLSEKIIPDQYPHRSQNQLWESISYYLPPAQQEKLANTNNLVLLEGRALYPRYFSANEGVPLTAKPGYAPSDKSRLVFSLLGDTPGRVIFQLSKAPIFFPNASDVIIITQGGSLNQAIAILVSKNQRSEFYFIQEQ